MPLQHIPLRLVVLTSLLSLSQMAAAQSTSMMSSESSASFAGQLQSAPSLNTTVVPTDDPVARQKLKTLLEQYARTDGSHWNVTLTLSVSESGESPISHSVQLIGSANVRRTLVRNGRQVISTFSNGTGVVNRDGQQENVPVWIVQSSKVPEFPFPALSARLQDPQTFVNFANGETSETGLIHIHLSTPRYDTRGKRRPVAERVYEVDLYFDSNTLLLTKERHWIFSPSSMTNATQVETRYSDYRAIGSIQVPFHTTKVMGGRVLSDTTLVSADLNANNSFSGTEASDAK